MCSRSESTQAMEGAAEALLKDSKAFTENVTSEFPICRTLPSPLLTINPRVP